MADADKLDCRVFVETNLPPLELATRLAQWLGGSVDGPAFAKTIHVAEADIEVRANDEVDAHKAGSFPDGFLSFAYALEIYPAPKSSLEDRVRLTTRLLESCWTAGLPAVAACDYEAELPKEGGYKDRTVPWPSASAQAIGAASPQRNGPSSTEPRV